jgi:integrase/recombinase XerD
MAGAQRAWIPVRHGVLLAGGTSDHIWISMFGTSMTTSGVYKLIVDFTRHVFGEAINPHRFRHIAATTLAFSGPEKRESARALLTQADIKTTERFYIIGQSPAACRGQANAIAKLRRIHPYVHGRDSKS